MNTISNHKTFFILLTLSLLFFIIKGIRYALIDSIIPLIFIFLIILSLTTFFYKEKKYFSFAIKSWSILLITWTLLRMIIPVLFYFTPGLTETHIREQFVIPEFLLSFMMLSIGVYLFRNIKNLIYKTV